MITNYGIYNNHELDNTLLVIFSDREITNSEFKNDILEVLYNNDEIIGYRIRNFIRYAKIKYSGIIFLPIDPIIDIINSILKEFDLEQLAYKKESGYVTKLNGDKLGVYALKGTFLRDQTVSQGRFCSYYDLFIQNDNEHSLVVIDDEIKENVDFFTSEEK